MPSYCLLSIISRCLSVWLSCSNKTVAIGALEGRQCWRRTECSHTYMYSLRGNRNLSNYDPEINYIRVLSCVHGSVGSPSLDNMYLIQAFNVCYTCRCPYICMCMSLGQCGPSQYHDIDFMHCATIMTLTSCIVQPS